MLFYCIVIEASFSWFHFVPKAAALATPFETSSLISLSYPCQETSLSSNPDIKRHVDRRKGSMTVFVEPGP